MPQQFPELTGFIEVDGQATHFTWEEARCNHCRLLPDNPQAVINAARMMERIREILGNNPVRVNSWFRCPEYNRRIGGASNSQHPQGRAIDFTVRQISPREVARRLRAHLGGNRIIGGLGSYPGFVHCDNRPDDRGAYWRE